MQKVVSRYDSVGHDHVNFTIEAFIHLLTGGEVMSAIETVDVVGDRLTSRAVLEVQPRDSMTSQGDVPIVVPVLRRKAQLFDSFEVTSASGAKLAPLPPEITHGFLAFTVLSLFRLYATEDNRQLDEAGYKVLTALTRVFCREDPIDESEVEHEFDQAIDELPRMNEAHRKSLLNVCLYFAANTVVAVETTEPGVLTVSFEYVITPPGRLATRHDEIRALLGLPPYRYRVPLNLPFVAQRYYLRVRGPEAQFVNKHGLALDRNGPIDTGAVRSWVQRTPGLQVTVHPDVGLPYADLTITEGRCAPYRYVECVVEIEEVPPGALGRTLLISGTCAILLLALAFLLPHTTDARDSGNLGAVLIALPAFAATWLGQSAERIQQSSVTTVAGLIATGLLSLAGTILFLLQDAMWGTWKVSGASILSLFPIPSFDPPWLLLGSLSTAVTVVLAMRWRHRMDRYREKLYRRDQPANAPRSGDAIPSPASTSLS